jgi:hypothetical protein
VFDFHQQMAVSEQPKVRALIERALRRRFPDLLAIHKAHVENDKRGIDYFLEFPNGRMETLDVKVRTKDFATRGDDCNVALETVANTTTKKPGWTLDADKLTDWVLFLWLDTERDDLVHFRQLRAALTANLETWLAARRASIQTTKTARGSYDAESLFVSSKDMWGGMYRLFSYVASAPETPQGASNAQGNTRP